MHLKSAANEIQSIISLNKNLTYNIIISGGIKGVAVLINVLTTPAYMRYFDNNSILGVWLTLISILTTISVLDFGLGNGLRNKLTEAWAKDEKFQAQKIISSGYFMIVIVSGIIFQIGFFLIGFLSWNSIFGIDDMLVSNDFLIQCVRIVFAGIIIQMVLKLITSILYADQKAALVSILPVLTNIFLLLFVTLTKGGSAQENFRRLSLVYFFSNNLPYLIITIIIFATSLKEYIPHIKYVNIECSKNIMKLGILFFYLQIMSILVHNTNEILISILFNSSLVVEYQVYNKIFYLITTVINVLMIPLWSAATKALSEKKYIWLRRLHTFLCMTPIGAFAIGLSIIPFMQIIVNIWLQEKTIAISYLQCLPFAIYVAEEAFNGANATIANGTGWIKAQIIMSPIGVVLNLPLTIIFKQLLDGWIAIQVANIFSLLPIALVQFLYIRKKLNLLERENKIGVDIYGS